MADLDIKCFGWTFGLVVFWKYSLDTFPLVVFLPSKVARLEVGGDVQEITLLKVGATPESLPYFQWPIELLEAFDIRGGKLQTLCTT